MKPQLPVELPGARATSPHLADSKALITVVPGDRQRSLSSGEAQANQFTVPAADAFFGDSIPDGT